jgi:hypothetical protein
MELLARELLLNVSLSGNNPAQGEPISEQHFSRNGGRGRRNRSATSAAQEDHGPRKSVVHGN